ncbi:hypothetical protein OAB59_02635 [Pelagibacteraceae bacterium]|nr:hypothetical protein [Pelagibacteraceae bacterium]
MDKKTIIVIIFILSIFLTSCGFKKINSDNSLIYLQNIEVIGENRIAYILKNNLRLISNENANKKYNLEVNVEKNKSSKIKNKAGKITRYQINISARLILKDSINNTVIDKNFSQSGDYEIAKMHSETISNEKKILKEITQELSDEIGTFIMLSFKN